MFTEADRTEILARLVDHARADPALCAAALVGSGARRTTDRWSDIDLAVGLIRDADPLTVANAWRAHLASEHALVDHLDVWSGAALYRVFLLADSLQIDVSFWPAGQFGSNGEPFELLFGEANDPTGSDGSAAREVIGWAWLQALHARSAIARNHPWQAMQMLDGLRDRVITLACLRHGAPAHQGRGVDQLPVNLLSQIADTLVAAPESDRLAAAFGDLVDLLAREVEDVDPSLAVSLSPTFAILIETVRNRTDHVQPGEPSVTD